MQTIPAHRVLDWIADQEGGARADRVIAWSEVALGTDARFHLCERSGMGIRELLEFVVLAGKVAVVGNRLYLEAAPVGARN